MDPNKNYRGVHFKPSTEQLNQQHQQQQQQQQRQQSDPTQFVQTWQQRHSILNKLTTTILSTDQELLEQYQHLKPSTTPNCELSHQFGFLLERAQQQQQQPTIATTPTPSEQKLLQRCLRTQIEPSKDFILIRKISDGQSGSVHLIRTRLSSLESLNQSNFYILKKVSKRVSRRIQQYSSIETELSILLLSRGSTSSGVKRQPKLHLSFQTATDLHLVLEYSMSGSIADHLGQGGGMAERRVSEAQLRGWTVDVLAGLDWLHHRHRFCHRDVKPANLLINHPDGHILLTDFATAAPLVLLNHSNPPRSSDTLVVPRNHRVVIVGTCDYIAPEVLETHLTQTIATLSHSTVSGRPTASTPTGRTITITGGRHDQPGPPASPNEHDEPASNGGAYGPEIDLWSFGVSLFEMIYGRLPFFCPSINDTYSKIVDHKSHLKIPEVRGRNSGTDYGQRYYPDDDDDDDDEQEEEDQEEPVSGALQSFLKVLLCSRENRIGCGSEGLQEVKAHEWFRGLDWDEAQRRPVPDFQRSPIDINRLGDSVCLDEGAAGAEGDDDQRFNFSAFFGSSPGLSTLKSNTKKNKKTGEDGGSWRDDDDDDSDEDSAGSEESDEFFGFTYLPSDPDEFNRAQEDHQSRQRLKSSIKRGHMGQVAEELGGPRKPGHDDRFSTPIKPTWRSTQTPGSSVFPLQAPPTGRGSRSVRVETRPDGRTVPLSQIDQLILLNQIVLSTAKKATPFAQNFSLISPPFSNNHQQQQHPPPRRLDSQPNSQLTVVHQLELASQSVDNLLLKINRLIAQSDSIILNAQPP
ncbi:hypothetical protein PGT21_020407 [Puccinia graminis f. sp. tritici]|uniref:Protein kinase domain-containing protein n=1 Tax=Puccinia graminis f. sp. tritici TaxID=56615 RepID=A0A5B0NEL0_PUCGR|nr:hypothetical protein PGT21_020407 [Puccinia graminis f. sp. tritici]